MKIALSIDPAYSKPDAFSVFDYEDKNATLMECGLLEDPWRRELSKLFELYPIEYLFIESQYMIMGRKGNPKTTIALAHHAGEVVGVTSGMGSHKAEYIEPWEWLTGFMKGRRFPARIRYMPAVVAITTRMYNLDEILKQYKLEQIEDICCSIQIGYFGMRKNQLI